jgi:hypothetical protein
VLYKKKQTSVLEIIGRDQDVKILVRPQMEMRDNVLETAGRCVRP